MYKRAAIAAVFMLCLCSLAYGQQDPIVQPSVVEQPMVVSAAVEQSAASKEGVAEDGSVGLGLRDADIQVEQPAASKEGVAEDGLVSLDLRDADIQDVLRVLAYKSGVNIVTGPEVVGLVTIKLVEVPWQRALDVVLQTYGYAYDRKGNIVSVTTIENLKKRREDATILAEQERMETKTFFLSYAKSSQIITSIEKMCTERGSVNFDERTNALIVQDTPSNLELIEEVVLRLDATTPQVLIEARIIETTLGDTEKLGINWNLQASGKGSKWNSTFPLRRGNSGNFVMPIPVKSIDSASGLITYDATNLFTFGTLDFSAFTVLMQMLETRSNVNTLSNPRLVTLDNQAARIFVGRQYPFPKYEYNKERGEMQVTGWEFKDIGVIFEVTPHINNAEMITLDLKPKVTAIIDGATVVVEGTTVPQLTVRETETRVMIRNGETLVIGGLISDDTVTNESKVPILGSIPFLGRLFRHNSTEKTKTDLLIFITPHIITPERETKVVVAPQAQP